MLGQPLYMLAPEVVGFELTGELPPGATATDLVLTVTANPPHRGRGRQVRRVLRLGHGHDEGRADRATIGQHGPRIRRHDGLLPHRRADADLSPQDRADRRRSRAGRALHQGAATCSAPSPSPRCAASELHEGACVSTWRRSSRAWPARNDRRTACRWPSMKQSFRRALAVARRTSGASRCPTSRRAKHGRRLEGDGRLGHGAVVIAAITSCTNTSNPSVMLAAGLLARKAVERGLTVKPHVKTSLSPGSPRGDRLSAAGRAGEAARALGFHTVGYGCTTCIGNSGPLARAGGQGRHRGRTWSRRRC